MGNKSELSAVEPTPIEVEDSPEEIPSERDSFGVNYKRLSTLASIMYNVQKYSSYTFSIFAGLHGVNVLITPVISTSIADEVLSMSRAVYQAEGLESVLVWGSLSTHVIAGITLRIIRNLQHRIRYGGSKRHDNALKRKRKEQSLDQRAIVKDTSGEVTVNDDKEVGLAGGVTNMVGLGPKKSYVFRKFGLSPLQMSGYLLIPLVSYHALQTRIVPLIIEGDSSYINFEFIAYLLSNTGSIWHPIKNWIVYPLLVVLSTYHSIYGLLKWNNVKNMKIRKTGAMTINILSLVGIWSLYTLSKIDYINSVPAFIVKKFDKYLDYFYYLKT